MARLAGCAQVSDPAGESARKGSGRPSKRFTARLERKDSGRQAVKKGRSGRLAAAPPIAPSSGPTFLETSFAAVDLETTGVLATDRVVEIAIVRFAGNGQAWDHWSTLMNPGRDLGACRIHRLLDWADVRHAPRFADVAGDVIERLRGAVLVAHNLRFEERFLRQELGTLGHALPTLPGVCTLELGTSLGVGSRRPIEVCRHLGIPLENAHSALADAWATARLLAAYLGALMARGITSLSGLGITTPHPPPEAWPQFAPGGLTFDRAQAALLPGTERPPAAEVPEAPLARLVERLPAGQAAHEAGYLDLLDRVLANHVLTLEEARELASFAEAVGLDSERVVALHGEYLDALLSTAWADGRITPEERRAVEAVAGVLGVPREAYEPRLVPPPGWKPPDEVTSADW